MSLVQFQSQRNNLAVTRFQPLPDWRALSLDGQVVIGVEKFALTANNITYGVAGDSIGYWNFFPADEPWGLIPVWGIGEVLESSHPSVERGERYYGYFPMASYLRTQPVQISGRGFSDGSEHRHDLPAVYNQYSRMTAANNFDPSHDDHRMLYWPLFATSFVLDDYLDDNNYFGASDIILSSASSKTAIGLAFLLHHNRNVNIIGLTSSHNREFVEKLGLYTQVVCYEDVNSLPAKDDTAYIDMSGNRELLARVHHHFTDHLQCSCAVGMTHWQNREGQEDPASLPGARVQMFFAPSQMRKRNQDWGPAEYQLKMNKAWLQFVSEVDQWIRIESLTGEQALADIYQTVLSGASPDRGYVISLQTS